MHRTIRLLIAYDGTRFHGWQRQEQGEATIQGELEHQLSRLCKETVTVHGAGRTDAGVHAQGMVAHFRARASLPLAAFSKGLNAMLPRDIRILEAEVAETGFHSRFSAQGKTYRYDFSTRAVIEPIASLYRAHFPGDFSLDRLRPALEALVGVHDFSSLERSGSRDTTAIGGRGAVRTLYRIACFPVIGQSDCWSLRVTGDGFLRQMVRIMAGTLIEIGQGRRDPEDMAPILAARDRTRAGLTAPACGLFLEQVHYPWPVFQKH